MFFPFMMDVSGKKLVIVGGGAVAARKCELFSDFGAEITVVAPEICPDIKDLGDKVFFVEDTFDDKYLSGAFAVIAATDDKSVNTAVYEYCTDHGIPVNVVDKPELCTFYVPAVVRRGDLTIGISTAGKSPSLAGHIRRELSERYGDEYGERLEKLGRLRDAVKENVSDIKERRSILTQAADMDDETLESLIDKIAGGSGRLRGNGI